MKDNSKMGSSDSLLETIRTILEKEHTVPKTPKEKSLAKLAHPKDKITHKDVLVGRGVLKKENSGDRMGVIVGTRKEKVEVDPKLKEEEQVDERKLTGTETEKKEKYVMSLKGKMGGFKKRYGERAKEVMYATATKMAKNEEVNQVDELDRQAGSVINRYISKTTDDPKRKEGRNLALKKKWGDKNYGLPEPKVKAVTREEVEQVDELSSKTLSSYKRKSGVQLKKIGQRQDDDEEDFDSLDRKTQDTVFKRMRGDNLLHAKAKRNTIAKKLGYKDHSDLMTKGKSGEKALAISRYKNEEVESGVQQKKIGQRQDDDERAKAKRNTIAKKLGYKDHSDLMTKGKSDNAKFWRNFTLS